MAAQTQNDSEEMITGINVTPLVDVVLVLLIIFMITAPAIYQAAIKVELPKASTGEQTEHVTLRLTMTKDGSILLGKEPVAREKIPEIAKQAIAKDPTANAIVSADSSLSHGQVIGLIDLVKQNGISRFAIGVDTPEAKKGSEK